MLPIEAICGVNGILKCPICGLLAELPDVVAPVEGKPGVLPLRPGVDEVEVGTDLKACWRAF
jgi:hypothetical protein